MSVQSNISYRMSVLDDNDKPITPRDASIHSDPFRVSTNAGVSGYQPYMEIPTGRASGIDILSRKTEIGQFTVDVLDRKQDDNSERWVTAFIGDDTGRESLSGHKAMIEYSLDGTNFEPYFTGTVTRVQTRNKLYTTLFIRGINSEFDIDIFTGQPSVDYAQFAPLWPLGAVDFGNTGDASTRDGLPGVFKHGPNDTFYIQSTDLVPGGSFLQNSIISAAFVKALNANNTPIGSFKKNQGRIGKKIRVSVTLASDGSSGSFDVWFFRENKFVRGKATPGDYVFAQSTTRKAGADEYDVLEAIGVRALPSDDADHLAVPADGTAVTFRIDPVSTAPSNDTPLVINHVHPVTLIKDIFSGKFSTRNTDGSVKFSYPLFDTRLDQLDDLDLPTFRGVITKKARMKDWIAENILVPYNLAYSILGDGTIYLSNMDIDDTELSSAVVIGEADLLGNGPTWSNDKTRAITRVDVNWNYARRPRNLADGLPSSGFIVEPNQTTALNPTSANVAEKTFDIKAPGLTAIEGDREEISPGVFVNTKSRDIYSYIRKRLAAFRGPFASGVQYVTVTTAQLPKLYALTPGDAVVLDLPNPNPASNTKAGRRVAWCVNRLATAESFTFDFVDAGHEVVAVSPVIGELKQVSGSPESAITFALTLNADGDPVEMETALTDTNITARPTTGWSQFDIFGESGTVNIDDLPSGTRVWVRGRSSPDSEHDAKLKSPWAYPTGNDYVDTKAFTGPTGGAHSDVTGCSANLTWSNTNDLAIELMLTRKGESSQVTEIPAGTTRYPAFPIMPNSEYSWAVRYIDPSGGRSTTTGTTFTTGSPDDSPEPVRALILVGRA